MHVLDDRDELVLRDLAVMRVRRCVLALLIRAVALPMRDLALPISGLAGMRIGRRALTPRSALGAYTRMALGTSTAAAGAARTSPVATSRAIGRVAAGGGSITGPDKRKLERLLRRHPPETGAAVPWLSIKHRQQHATIGSIPSEPCSSGCRAGCGVQESEGSECSIPGFGA